MIFLLNEKNLKTSAYAFWVAYKKQSPENQKMNKIWL